MSRLIGVDRMRFAEDFWGRRPLLTRADELPRDFSDLFSGDAVDELVSERGLRTPFLRVARDGATLTDRAFTAPGGVGAGIGDQVSDEKLVRLFADGSTLVLQALHRLWPALISFSQQLAADLGHPVQVNAYVTPPQNKGFSDHYDVHDVFVLQIEGEKRWLIHEPVLPSPLRSQPWNERRAAVEAAALEPPLMEVVLRPGDCLYLPRGYLHAAKALGGVTTHVTIGVHTWNRQLLAERLMQQALAELAKDPEVRRSLACGVSVNDADEVRGDLELVRERLLQVIQQIDAGAIVARLQGDARNAQRAAPLGPLRQLRASAELTPESVVRLRPHLSATIDKKADGRAMLHSRAGSLELSPAEAAVVAGMVTGGAPSAGQLGLELARRMLLDGVAVVE
nr:cupin domain-containing protein [Microlunatus panaciterrae]